MKDDLISRQAVLDAFEGELYSLSLFEKIQNLPTAQPETHEERTETHACDLISRQAVIEINRSYHGQMPNEVNHRIWKEINELPSAQPYLEEAYICGETEAEARFHAQQRWIPFKTRPLTEEEKEEHPEWDCILDCKLPDDGQAILVSIDLRGHESVQYDEFYTDDGSYLDSGYEIGDEAVAWMPLPEPYAERRTDEA